MWLRPFIWYYEYFYNIIKCIFHPCLECGFGLPMLSYHFWSPCEQALTRTSKWCMRYEPVPGSAGLAPELVLISMHHPIGSFGGIFGFQIPEPPTGSGNPSSFWFPLAPHHRFVWWHICGHHFLVRISTKIFNWVYQNKLYSKLLVYQNICSWKWLFIEIPYDRIMFVRITVY